MARRVTVAWRYTAFNAVIAGAIAVSVWTRGNIHSSIGLLVGLLSVFACLLNLSVLYRRFRLANAVKKLQFTPKGIEP